MSAPGHLMERMPRRVTSSMANSAVPFTKMHGAGNDFVCVDGVGEPALTARDDWARVARAVCDRRTGVGADGLILILPPHSLPHSLPHSPPAAKAHVRMRIFNADGSEAQMCGNGLRCVAKYAVEHGLATARPVLVQMSSRVAAVDYATSPAGGVERATVDMGEPSFAAADLPVRVEALPALLDTLRGGQVGRLLIESASDAGPLADGPTSIRWLSMGNPHIVFFCRDVRRLALQHVGPMIETHVAFPQRVNAQFAEVHSRGEVTVRTWERGAGATRACGSGAAAVCVAGVLGDLTDRRIVAHLPGGDLELCWDEPSRHVHLTGPAEEVFTGTWAG